MNGFRRTIQTRGLPLTRQICIFCDVKTDFGALYRRRYGVTKQGFTRSVLIYSTPWPRRHLLWIVLTLNPDVFRQDFKIIDRLGKLETRREFSQELVMLEHYHRYELPKWRRMLSIRMSIGKLSRFSKLFDGGTPGN